MKSRLSSQVVVLVVFTELEVSKMKNEKLDQEYSFDLRPASMEEAGLCYENPSPERRNEPACPEGRLIDSINC